MKRADGHGIWQTDNWQNGMGVVDFTNPKACKWYQGKLRSLLEMGVDCFKTDFGERIPDRCCVPGWQRAGQHAQLLCISL